MATLACVFATPEPVSSSWSARIAALLALLVGAALAWWTLRDLPRQTRPVMLAALRTDGPLRFTYAAIAACVVLLALVVITGFGMFAGVVWMVLGLLGVLALIVRVWRRLRG